MSESIVVLRQGEPLVVIRENERPLIVEREIPTAISVVRHGTTVEHYQNGQPAAWGAIEGVIADQADLQDGFTYAVDRSNHTGTQPIATISGLQQALDSKLDDAEFPNIVDGGNF